MTASESILRDLRALQLDAPPALRERVRALGQPPAGRSLPSLPWRRSLLVLAPACAVALVIAAVVHGLAHSGSPTQRVLAPATSGESGAGGSQAPFGAVRDSSTPGALRKPLTPPTAGRRQDYEASMTLRVQDLDALTDQTNEAMRIVRSFGGYVASVRQSTATGEPGQADLVVRVPVNRVEMALVQLSELGTVLYRQVSIVDLEQALRQQQARIVRLKVFIARATAQLKGDLPADVRIRLQLQLQEAQAALARATRAHNATLDEAAFSRVTLTLTTQRAVAPEVKGGMGRWERAARDAGGFLADAGAVVLFLLIVLSPVLVLVAAWALAWRAYRRREERRLLAT
jgi:hypothetical protein